MLTQLFLFHPTLMQAVPTVFCSWQSFTQKKDVQLCREEIRAAAPAFIHILQMAQSIRFDVRVFVVVCLCL